MPNWVSIGGKFMPAIEVVQIQLSQEDLLAGKNPVYKGPDRAALAMMVEQGHAVVDPEGPIHYFGEDPKYIGKRFKITDYPGRDSFTDPDVLRMARTYGYKSVAEYLEEMYGIKKEEMLAKSNALLKGTIFHDPKIEKKAAVNELAGGEDRSGQGKHRKGGFGEPDDVPTAALKARA